MISIENGECAARTFLPSLNSHGVSGTTTPPGGKSAEILKYVIKLTGSFNLQKKMKAIDSYGQRKTHMRFGANWRKFCQAFHESFKEDDEVN